MRRLRVRRALAALLIAWLGADPAQAQEQAASRLQGGWTTFAAMEAAGGEVEVGGRFDLAGVLEGRDAGLWRGFSLGGHGEWVYGHNITEADPVFLLPPNTALFFPASNEPGLDLSLAVTQRLGPATATLGKINMIDQAALTPLVGGGGVEGFQHLQFAAPLTNMTPASVFGALVTLATGRAIVTIGAWDSESAVGRAWPENGFADVSGLLGVTAPVSLMGLPGFQTLQAQATTEDRIDLDDLGYLAIPEGLRPDIDERQAGWMLKYSFQQYLWRHPSDLARGWGLFGQVNVWDGGSTLTDWAFSLGVAGSGPSAARPRDGFGLGYFIVSPSDALIDSLESMALPIRLREETGVEGFYTWQVGDRWRLTTTGQAIRPGIGGIETAYILGLRARVGF